MSNVNVKYNYKKELNINSNILKYSKEMFSQFSYSTQRYFAEKAIEEKKYYELAHILKISSEDYLANNLLYFAVDKSDKKALITLTDSMKNSANNFISNGTSINSCITNYILDDSLFKPKLDEFQKDAIKLVLDVKTNSTITAEDLQLLSFTGPEDEFKQFCEKKEVNLTDIKFQGLDLSHYKYIGKSPVVEIPVNSTQYNLVDVLLNKTYSDLLPANDIKEIYENIYAINNDGKETLTYIATLMDQGHPLKIIFENGTLSYYSHLQNIIKIDTNFVNEVQFNIESVVAHEMKHFIYDQVFKFDSRPIDLSPMREIKEKADNIFEEDYSGFEQDNVEMEFVIRSFDFFRNHVFNNNSGIITFIETIQQYQAAAIEPLKYAAKLLGINPIDSNYTITWAQHLKFNSKIDLFNLETQSTILKESLSNIDTVSDATYHSLFNMYQEHEVPKFHNKTEILKWAKEELYPEFIKELNLSKPEVHFIERMADLVNRAEFFPQYSCNIRDDSEQIEVESIVRSLELKLSIGNETKIMDTFIDLDQFHTQHATPIICAFLKENSQIASLPFSEKYLAGEVDICDISTCE